MSPRSLVVAALSRADLERIGTDTRRHLDIGADARINMVRLIEFVLPLQLPGFDYEIADDAELGGAEAITSMTEYKITISHSSYDAARGGSKRPQFTLAHELGHLLLHSQRPASMARGKVEAFRDPEWQADGFAGAFLVPAAAARHCRSLKELSARFGISDHAALVRARILKLDHLLSHLS